MSEKHLNLWALIHWSTFTSCDNDVSHKWKRRFNHLNLMWKWIFFVGHLVIFTVWGLRRLWSSSVRTEDGSLAFVEIFRWSHFLVWWLPEILLPKLSWKYFFIHIYTIWPCLVLSFWLNHLLDCKCYHSISLIICFERMYFLK